MINKTHYLFLLNFSPWPLLIRLNSFNLILSFFFFLKFFDLIWFLIRLTSISLTSFFWWINYSSEFNLEGKNSDTLERGIKIAMILFIFSEVFFFFSFFWSYFHFILSPVLELGLYWPSENLIFFDFLRVPIINTLILIGSGLTVTARHYYLIKGGKKKSKIWLAATIFLGVLFSLFQLIEYKNSFFSIRDGRFGSSFFVLTGFHGIHVLIGSIFLLSTLIRSVHISGAKSRLLRFELSSWYWHFVDLVWIFLYFFLYYLSN